ncbi:MAG: tRNA dihydrouridine synthase DusB [Deltaproteobacteria bacterium]|nr:MAG: tRNA dihydrouridine synthase DusB [Deltaproteobacteria bacterium]
MAMFINQPLILAPMAGITDSPFRQLAKKFGADLVVTEMISARGLIQDDRKTKAMLSFQPLEQPLIVQLFGREPEILRAAALKALDAGAACIDINMGCPVKKVIKTGAGAALLKDLKQIKKILQALSQSPEIPYTIKIRAGWDHTSLNAGTVFQLAADHGAKAVFCHPRTATMMFGGAADWDYLEETARQTAIPVIGSGDITTPIEARQALSRVGIAGLMLGRGALGKPWLFRNIKEFIRHGKTPPINWSEKLASILLHWELLEQHKGKHTGFLLFRKHLAWYSRGLPGAAAFRQQIFSSSSREELTGLMHIFFEPLITQPT